MSVRPILIAGPLIVGLMVLAGCAAVKGPEQPVTLRLAPASSAPSSAAPIATPLAIAPVQARGLAGALRYTYVDAAAPAEIRQAKTLFWEEPPTRVLERALAEGLRGRFATVTGPTMPGAPDARRVIAELDRFEETGAGGDARAIVAFAVTVTGHPLLAGRYCGSAPIPSATGTDRAHAFEGAITTAVDGFVQDMAQGVLSRGTC